MSNFAAVITAYALALAAFAGLAIWMGRDPS